MGYGRGGAAAGGVCRLGPGEAGAGVEIGAGTGTNSLWLAAQGFDVLGIDVASRAIERATAKLNGRALHCRFAARDFLTAAPSDAPFEFAFDRGCFHVFDEPEERARFAAQIAATLAPGGLWLSLIGSTEGPPREVGPPRRSAREVADAIEPASRLSSCGWPSFAVTMPLHGCAFPVGAWYRRNRPQTRDRPLTGQLSLEVPETHANIGSRSGQRLLFEIRCLSRPSRLSPIG